MARHFYEFPTSKPQGFTDDLDTLIAAIANYWDTAVSRAVDGLNGGVYNLAAGISLLGDIVTIENLTVTGKLLFSGTASGAQYRADYTTMVHTGPSTINVTSDVFVCTGVLTANRVVTVDNAVVVPSDGQRITAVNTLGGGGDFELIFQRTGGAVELGRIKQDAATNQGGSLTFQYINDDWHAIDAGGWGTISDHGSTP